MNYKSLLFLVLISSFYACSKFDEPTAPVMELECLSHPYDDYTRIVTARLGDTIDFKLTFIGDNLAELKLMQVGRMEVYDINGFPDNPNNGVTELRFQNEIMAYGFPYTTVSNEMFVSVVADTIIKDSSSPLHNFAMLMSNEYGEIAFKYVRYEIK